MCYFCETRCSRAKRELEGAWQKVHEALARLEEAKKEKKRILKISWSLTPELAAIDDKVVLLK